MIHNWRYGLAVFMRRGRRLAVSAAGTIWVGGINGGVARGLHALVLRVTAGVVF